MYFDLNIPIPQRLDPASNKKGKGKQDEVFSSSQVEGIEARIDLLVHCMLNHHIHYNIKYI